MMDFKAVPSEMDVLTSAASGMRLQRSLLDLSARNVAAAQASTPARPYARLVAEIGAGSAADPDDDAAIDPAAGEDDAAPASGIIGVRSEPGTGDALAEMVAVLDAQRAYEQNASLFDTGKRLAERTIDIGRS